MATKAAFAAGLAWSLAPLLPFADAQYSYYAPLGVLVSMYPTVAASARSGFHALVGLTIGIGIGLAGVAANFAGAPAVVSLSIVIGVGVLLAGVKTLGDGRSLVAVAALFVLLLTGRDVDEFSLSYLITMAFGVMVGIVVNLAIVPPLYLKEASGRLSSLRDDVSAFLTSMADHVESKTVNADVVDQSLDRIDHTLAEVREEVLEADDSRRANPRGRRHRREQEDNLARLRALERTVFHTRDFADVLIEIGDEDDLSASTHESFVAAIRSCSELVGTPVNADELSARLEDAESALAVYFSSLSETTQRVASLSADKLTPAACLRRIVDASLPFVRTAQ